MRWISVESFASGNSFTVAIKTTFNNIFVLQTSCLELLWFLKIRSKIVVQIFFSKIVGDISHLLDGEKGLVVISPEKSLS